MLKQNWCFTGTDERRINMLEKKMLQQVMNESLFGFRDIISLDDFISFLFFSFYMCICIKKNTKPEHSVWPWLSHMIVTWSLVDWGASGVLDVQSVCDPRVFLFDGCLLFPRPLCSTHLHVPLFSLTTLFQPSSWSKGEIKLALFIDGGLKIRKWLTREFFSPNKRKKNLFGFTCFTHSKQSRLFWELSAEAAVQTSPTLPFHLSHSGQCFRTGVPILD